MTAFIPWSVVGCLDFSYSGFSDSLLLLLSHLSCPVTGRRARPSPLWLYRVSGSSPVRSPARQLEPDLCQSPPRYTRTGPSWEEVHCRTLPCMSQRPSLFGGYVPTRVGRSKHGPLFAFPN